MPVGAPIYRYDRASERIISDEASEWWIPLCSRRHLEVSRALHTAQPGLTTSN